MSRAGEEMKLRLNCTSLINGCYPIVDEKNRTVAFIVQHPGHDVEATKIGRILAAAFELYEVTKEIQRTVLTQKPCGEFIKQIDEAIAKAEGSYELAEIYNRINGCE